MMTSAQHSIQGVIKHHQKKLGDIQKNRLACEKNHADFISTNQIAYDRYIFLQADIAKKEKEALTSSEECKESIISSVSQINIFGENLDEFEKHIKKFRQLLTTSCPEINNMKKEMEHLKQQIEPFLNQNQQDLSRLKQEEEKHQSELNQIVTQSYSELCDAIQQKNFEKAKSLYDPVIIDYGNKHAQMPLRVAIEVESYHIAGWLLTKGDINFQERLGINLFETTIRRHDDKKIGSLGIIQSMFSCGAQINQKFDGNGFTPLHCAAETGSIECIRALIKVMRADINAQDNDGNTPLMIFSRLHQSRENYEEIVQLFQPAAKPSGGTPTKRTWIPLFLLGQPSAQTPAPAAQEKKKNNTPFS